MPVEIIDVGPPPPKHEPLRESDLEALARWMDSLFHIPGIGLRFGLDAIVGLIPGFGDTLTSLVSLYILNAAARYGIPRVTLVRMAANIALDYVLGSLPFVGDLFDLYWKANQKNTALLRRHLQATPVEERKARKGDWLFVAGLSVVLVALLIASVAVTVAAMTWVAHLLLQRAG